MLPSTAKGLYVKLYNDRYPHWVISKWFEDPDTHDMLVSIRHVKLVDKAWSHIVWAFANKDDLDYFINYLKEKGVL